MLKITVIASLMLSLLLSSCASKQIRKDVLYSFDTAKMGSQNMDIKIKELENYGNYSFIRELVYKRGSYAGSIMLSICSYSLIAKKRGYTHFVTLSSKDYKSCDTCEMSWDKAVGFLKNVPTELLHDFEDREETNQEKELRMKRVSKYLFSIFPENLIDEKDIEIMSVKDYWLICKDVSRICSW